jgi:hypothetical protein
VIKESSLTDENVAAGTDDEGVDWGDVSPGQGVPMPGYDDMVANARSAPTYPDYGPLPEARFSLNMAPDKAPMITIRAQTAADMTSALQELEDHGTYANLAAAWASLKAQGTVGAGLGPVTPVAPPQAPSGPVAGPYGAPPVAPGAVPQASPPPFGPNVSVPQAPGYQGPPPQQQQGGWGGQQRSNGPQEKPRPAGWLMVDVPYNDKQRFKDLRAQGTETGNYLRGKIQWGGKGVYWLEPSIAGWLAQQGFPVTQ